MFLSRRSDDLTLAMLLLQVFRLVWCECLLAEIASGRSGPSAGRLRVLEAVMAGSIYRRGLIGTAKRGRGASNSITG